MDQFVPFCLIFVYFGQEVKVSFSGERRWFKVVNLSAIEKFVLFEVVQNI